jgi:hypothetical protein
MRITKSVRCPYCNTLVKVESFDFSPEDMETCIKFDRVCKFCNKTFIVYSEILITATTQTLRMEPDIIIQCGEDGSMKVEE